MHVEFFEHESEICQTMPFLVLCLVLTIPNSFFFHVKVRFFQDIDIQDDAIGNMLVNFPSLLTCSPYVQEDLASGLSFSYHLSLSVGTLIACLSVCHFLSGSPLHNHTKDNFL